MLDPDIQGSERVVKSKAKYDLGHGRKQLFAPRPQGSYKPSQLARLATDLRNKIVAYERSIALSTGNKRRNLKRKRSRLLRELREIEGGRYL